ncbi:SAM-dependent methyltransferase [Pelomonas saccharophila]|uniref:SAM-dependent methyltransferase n=1 Tax=Roseateles saccharophilus TaxID=304 RepID=A0ABU1YIY6_ROSSA|nr:class I SAM-dependent methyltransferase [Roseateles saccharophilus]MDR7268814.1 SAM-dependent methyltransferase [Roseateles saccharophilus]
MWITRWPLPALWSWLAAWFIYAAALGAGLSPGPALALGAAVAAALAWLNEERWRRLIVALGFPTSVLALGWQGGASGLLWLAPLALLWWLYPRRTWSEAPLFPTPRGALERLPALAPLPPGARVLDAGCGVGDGLRELVHIYPEACVEGVEWSRPLAWAARLRVRGATVRQGDLWADDWAPFALVYVFQRPESMPRVWAKACAELAPGAWLASLDFAVPDAQPVASWQLPGGQFVWLYRPVRNGAAKPAN